MSASAVPATIAAPQPAPQHPGFFASHFGHAQPAVAPGTITYTPQMATAQGYQQYMQYAHSPQYHGAVLSQQAYIQADTNHDGKVSQAEMQYATAHYQPTAAPVTTYMPAAATAQGYQQYVQYAHSPQYHGAVLTQAQFIAADTNHDGTVQQSELKMAGKQKMEITNIKTSGGSLKSGMIDKSDPYVYFVINPPGWFNKVTGQTTVKKNDTQPNWAGEVVKMENFDKVGETSMDIEIYDKDMLHSKKLATCKLELGPLFSKGTQKIKVDNNVLKDDVYIEFDYTTTWGPEPPKPKKKSKKKKKSGGCC